MHLTHLGHSGLLVDVAGTRLLIDPGVFSDISDVTDLDAVLVTHQHPDHLDPGKLGVVLRENPGVPVYADPQSVEMLAGQGISATPNVAGQSFEVGGITVTPAGEKHAVIHEYIPRIDNVGLLMTADGEPSLFHPGDALDAEPAEPVDLLAVPVNAPWAAVKDMVAFVRRIAPRLVVPIHDALLTEVGRSMYLNHIREYGLEGGVPVKDLRDTGAAEFGMGL